MAMVADPAGAVLYLMRPDPPAGQPDATSDVFDERQPQHVGWNELATGDPATAREFYGNLFGWVTDDFMDMGQFGQYRFIDHGGQRIGAMAGPMPEPAAHWRYYINVPSIGTAIEAVTAGGGTITNGPHEVPGGMHIIIGTDPQGAEFALVGQQ
jgi:predicted enzyme related to lactoylglutathione lyase